jgi:group I intron endonuclease
MRKRVAGIYQIAIARGDKPEKFYIGQSHDIERRLREHRRALAAGAHYNLALQRAYNKYGEQALRSETLTVCAADKAELNLHEQRHVDERGAGNLFNLKLQCVVSSLGTKASAERRAKIAAALTGIKRSKETRAKVGAAQAWKKTEEGRVRLSACQQGRRPVSDETRARQSAAHMGRTVSPETTVKRNATRAANAEERGYWYSPESLAARAERAALRPKKEVSAETRAKLSAAGIGKKRSPDICAKISQSNLGRVMSPEAIEKTRSANIGRKQSPEHAAKGALARTGLKRSPETRQKMRAARLRYLAQSEVDKNESAWASEIGDRAD